MPGGRWSGEVPQGRRQKRQFQEGRGNDTGDKWVPVQNNRASHVNMISHSYEELKSLVLLNRLGSRRSVLDLLEQGMAPAEVVEKVKNIGYGEAGKGDRHEQPQADRRGDPAGRPCLKEFNPEREIETCEKLGFRLVALFDEEYPVLLRQIHDPPLVLYVKGDFDESDEAATAIVGTRHPTFYGLTHAKKFGRELAERGLTIVSGFAKGIDQAAHEAALQIPYGRTLAVLGCGLDVEYPRGSRKLFDQISERGAILSEYALGMQPLSENFPRRNRIISGLSLGVLVVEAAMRSGSLITAHEAIEQGREVFAVPGSIDQLTSRGTHALLKEGAVLVESSGDILEALQFRLKDLVIREEKNIAQGDLSGRKDAGTNTKIGPQLLSMSEEEQTLIRILANRPLRFDEMTLETSLAAPRLASSLTSLELMKKVVRKSDGRFHLVNVEGL